MTHSVAPAGRELNILLLSPLPSASQTAKKEGKWGILFWGPSAF